VSVGGRVQKPGERTRRGKGFGGGGGGGGWGRRTESTAKKGKTCTPAQGQRELQKEKRVFYKRIGPAERGGGDRIKRF